MPAEESGASATLSIGTGCSLAMVDDHLRLSATSRLDFHVAGELSSNHLVRMTRRQRVTRVIKRRQISKLLAVAPVESFFRQFEITQSPKATNFSGHPRRRWQDDAIFSPARQAASCRRR